MSEIMERIGREALIGFLVGLIIGLIIGLPILGWYVFPVKWYDTDPFDLRQEHKEAYISMLADSYALNPSVALAKQRVEGWDPEELGRIIGQVQAKTIDGAQIKRLSNLAVALGVEVVPPQPTPQPVAAPSLARRLLPIVGIPVALVLVSAGVIVGFLALRERRPAVEERARPSRRPERAVRPERIGEPLDRFVASYTLGQDNYDQPFYIETPTGEFLGECGMGISEVISAGPPANVTAFEVWLFEKDYVRTVTKVLMSNYAYHDDALRAKLAPKGEAVLVEPGKTFVLETASLRVEAEISEVEYGDEAAPPQSYFTRLTVTLTPSLKAPSEEATF